MTLNEFKAFFDGFAMAVGDAPTPEQWSLLKEKLAEVSDPIAKFGQLMQLPEKFEDGGDRSYGIPRNIPFKDIKAS